MNDDKSREVKTNAIGQRHYGNALMIVFLSALSAFPALSTDLYLPALPDMAKLFGVSESLANLTLISFFIAYSVMILMWGPISDKVGRRPVLIIGCACYFAAGVLCAVANSIYFLIIARTLQAAGGAAGTAMGTAIIKDVFHTARREKVLAMVQSINVICPAVAPMLGSLLLTFTNWRGIFFGQAVFGIVVFIASLLFTESIGERLDVKLFATLGRLFHVLHNGRFVVLLIVFTILNLSGMAFVGSSSYIYIDYYGLSPRIYSLFFAFNALCMMGGPFIYMWLSDRVKRASIIIVCLLICLLSGIAVMLCASFGPFAFALALVPSFVAGSCIKPPGVFLMLDQQKGDTGSASSIINSGFMVMGTIGIAVAGIPVWDFPHLVGLITAAPVVISIVLWLIFARKNA